jgi:hypothetical protein
MSRGLLDHVQDDPAQIGDGLVRPVEADLAQQSRVQVPRSQVSFEISH